jgi:hypothetical protein
VKRDIFFSDETAYIPTIAPGRKVGRRRIQTTIQGPLERAETSGTNAQ